MTYFFTRQPKIFASENQLTGRVYIEKLAFGVLEDAANSPTRLGKRSGRDAQIVHPHLTQKFTREKMWCQAVDQSGNRGLTAAGWTAEYHDLAASDGKIQVVHALSGSVFAAVMEAHIFESDHTPAAPFVVTSTTIVALSAAKSSMVI